MQNEIVSDNYSNARPELTQPHFDEEATLLSARPVVPLEVVEAKTDNHRSFLFAGTVVVAVILGVLGGILFYSGSVNPVASQEAVVNDGAAKSLPADADDTETVAEAAFKDSVGGAEEMEAPLDQPVEDLKLKKTKAVIIAPSVQPNSDSPNSEGGSRPKAQLFGVIRERKAASRKQSTEETREERRPRRVGSRRASGPNTSSDDLFRIGEIFEGSRP